MAILTQWGEALKKEAPLQEYPRMQLQRKSYTNLNGIWEYQITGENESPKMDRWKKIVVPFALGSVLSGTTEQLEPGLVLWYRKQFSYQPSYLRTWLNFEGVDQECTVWVNGIEAGSHQGGYAPFSLDISSMIKYQNALVVRCRDYSDTGIYAYGKQKIEHGGMWYTPSSGIWQTVWLEDIPEHAVHDIKITPDYDAHTVYIDMAGDFSQALITVMAGRELVHQGLTDDRHYAIPIENIHAWTPDDPFLYDVFVKTEDDLVRSYFGIRKFASGYDSSGKKRFCLNDKPLFLTGLLDQGYTPDGLMTYPDDEAMIYELKKIKSLGFNMLRKHVKVECRRWYYHCDRLGILVMQDMPNGGGPYDFNATGIFPNLGMRRRKDTERAKALGRVTDESCEMYMHELDDMLDTLYNAVSVFAWVPFNEGWGQFDSARITEHIRDYDRTRLVDSASGWHDQGAGDFNSRHVYFTSFRVPKDDGRIVLLSEFGGYAYLEYGHSAAEKLYGYKKFTDKLALDEAVHKLYDRDVLGNIRKGLAGCIYTQVSDVEDECNGIFTADRKIIKIDERKMRKMNLRCIRRLK